VRVGVIVPMSASDGGGRTPSWPDIRAFAEHAEAAGLDSVWVCDHFFGSMPGASPEGVHEAWTLATALATATTRVEVGQLVTCAAYRNPGLLAKMAVTADAVSGGRLVLGLGAGWHDTEYDAFGYPTDHRVSRLEEALEIVVPLLRGETVSFGGRFHGVADAVLLPPPDRRIPLLVAGNGPRILRLTARHAEAWNTAWFAGPDERLRERVAALESALGEEGRDPSTLRRTVGMYVADPAVAPDESDAFTGSVDELAETLTRFGELGFADVIAVLEPMNEQSLDRLAEARSLVVSAKP
jgi:alkanesulfonate monooxygenase SsuD/methylene tetrahydromethanopterin reductase-like flavin-dependent oxidoreductase (luciferase family)